MRARTVSPQGGSATLTLVARRPGRVEVSQLFLYILQHPERVLILRAGHTVGDAHSVHGHCRYTLDQSARRQLTFSFLRKFSDGLRSSLASLDSSALYFSIPFTISSQTVIKYINMFKKKIEYN